MEGIKPTKEEREQRIDKAADKILSIFLFVFKRRITKKIEFILKEAIKTIILRIDDDESGESGNDNTSNDDKGGGGDSGIIVRPDPEEKNELAVTKFEDFLENIDPSVLIRCLLTEMDLRYMLSSYWLRIYNRYPTRLSKEQKVENEMIVYSLFETIRPFYSMMEEILSHAFEKGMISYFISYEKFFAQSLNVKSERFFLIETHEKSKQLSNIIFYDDTKDFKSILHQIIESKMPIDEDMSEITEIYAEEVSSNEKQIEKDNK